MQIPIISPVLAISFLNIHNIGLKLTSTNLEFYLLFLCGFETYHHAGRLQTDVLGEESAEENICTDKRGRISVYLSKNVLDFKHRNLFLCRKTLYSYHWLYLNIRKWLKQHFILFFVIYLTTPFQ
jgi:hypothetical protein